MVRHAVKGEGHAFLGFFPPFLLTLKGLHALRVASEVAACRMTLVTPHLDLDKMYKENKNEGQEANIAWSAIQANLLNSRRNLSELDNKEGADLEEDEPPTFSVAEALYEDSVTVKRRLLIPIVLLTLIAPPPRPSMILPATLSHPRTRSTLSTSGTRPTLCSSPSWTAISPRSSQNSEESGSRSLEVSPQESAPTRSGLFLKSPRAIRREATNASRTSILSVFSAEDGNDESNESATKSEKDESRDNDAGTPREKEKEKKVARTKKNRTREEKKASEGMKEKKVKDEGKKSESKLPRETPRRKDKKGEQ